jgi:hypothetical protein
MVERGVRALHPPHCHIHVSFVPISSSFAAVLSSTMWHSTVRMAHAAGYPETQAVRSRQGTCDAHSLWAQSRLRLQSFRAGAIRPHRRNHRAGPQSRPPHRRARRTGRMYPAPATGAPDTYVSPAANGVIGTEETADITHRCQPRCRDVPMSSGAASIAAKRPAARILAGVTSAAHLDSIR